MKKSSINDSAVSLTVLIAMAEIGSAVGNFWSQIIDENRETCAGSLQKRTPPEDAKIGCLCITICTEAVIYIVSTILAE